MTTTSILKVRLAYLALKLANRLTANSTHTLLVGISVPTPGDLSVEAFGHPRSVNLFRQHVLNENATFLHRRNFP